MTPPDKPEPGPSPPGQEEEPLRESKEGKSGSGVAGGVLRGLADLIPGLGGLLRRFERSDAFRERLAEIDREVQARLRGERGEAEGGRRPPPGAALGPSASRRESGRCQEEGRRPREAVAELFEEGDYLRVVVEMPGIKEDSIRVHLKGKRLLIAAESPLRNYRQWVHLPRSPESVQKTSCKNGILEVKLVGGR